MSQAAIIINVSDHAHSHANGLSGIFTVPPKGEEEFGMLVVYPSPEIQDIGSGRKEIHWPKVVKIAEDIVGKGSDSTAHTVGARGGKEKWGLFLCAADPDIPKELIAAIEEEIEYLNTHPPDVKMVKDYALKANVAVNIEADSVKARKEELSANIQQLRADFEAQCRKLVKKDEIARAKKAMQAEDQRMVAEADQMYARGEQARKDINELHQAACRRMGQERPWCYTPMQLVDCPGCGGKIKENVLFCSHCQGRLFAGIEELRKMKPAERAAEMYPDMVDKEPVTSGKK